MEETITPFCIGHHEANRPLPATLQTITQAHKANYDMITCPITNTHFQSRVLALLSSFQAEQAQGGNDLDPRSNPFHSLEVPVLSPVDTPLTPNDSMSQIIATTATWTDLCSPDPLIADISRQILKLELTYAAFCGILYVMIPAPHSMSTDATDSRVSQYARIILDGLSLGPFMQFYIWFPMIAQPDNHSEQMGDLTAFVKQDYKSAHFSFKGGLDVFGAWATWDTVRSICKYHSRLCVALSIPKLLPPASIQSRWYSEPVRLLTFEKQTFSKNAKGYPALSKPHQTLISRFMRLKTPPWFLLCDVGSLPNSAEANTNRTNMDPSRFPTPAEAFEKSQASHVHGKDLSPHLSYMRFLQSRQPPQTQIERFGAGYQDYLQAPLQPLTVNLESITYEVFEKDPVKYDWYEKAIARALHDWIEQGKPTSGADGRVVVAVVGAGRGPLVTRALRAADGVDVEIDMWALEKNPNAFVLLQRHNATIWDQRVNLVRSDMRTWRGPSRSPTLHIPSAPTTTVTSKDAQSKDQAADTTFTGDPSLDYSYLLATTCPPTNKSINYKIDILISELLGSFADNELSPECLDGVQYLMNPTNGISIPASYSAHLSPIAAPKLYADISSQSLAGNPNAAETPYVVMLNAVDYLSTTRPEAEVTAAPQQQPTPIIHEVWSFSHPNAHVAALAAPGSTSPPQLLTNTHNTRSASLTFFIPHRATCHGLAGYFETVLYGSVELSTNPNTMDRKSEGMISWFPIYFPLKSPIYVPDDSEMTVHMWRQTDDRKVWYEWMVDVFAILPSNGKGKEREGLRRRIRIGGSELHSSVKEACLM